MALRLLMLNAQLTNARNALDELLKLDASFDQREKDLEVSIGEAKTDEERSTVEAAVTTFENERKAHEDKKTEAQSKIDDLEKQIREAEKQAPAAPQIKNNEREANKMPEIRTNFFNMTMEQRDAFFAREDVKNFIGEVRKAFADIRSISNAGLTIPEVMLDLMLPEIHKASVLMPYVSLEQIKGTARQVLMGTIPEAVWTEACAKLNELDLGFNDVDFDGYKVGGYYAVCNALLEDNDVDLAQKLMLALSAGIAYAVDKAIIYGSGNKMPLGIVTRLAQTSEPENYPATARPWVDLHTSNIVTGSAESGKALFQTLAGYAKLIINDYFDGEFIWIMNAKTHLDLKIQAAEFNSNAALVSNVDSVMPVAGGRIVEFKGVPDKNIIVGYGKAYKLVERKGITLGQSEHFLFTSDKTVIKGTARYDGKPVIAEAFALITIDTTVPTEEQSFAEDYANESMQILTLVAAASATASGKTKITVTDMKDSSNDTLKYKVKADVNNIKVGDKVTGFADLTSGTTEITAAAGVKIAVVELDSAGRVVGAGTVISVPKA